MTCPGLGPRRAYRWVAALLAGCLWVAPKPLWAAPSQARSETQLLAHIDAIDRSLVRAESALAAGDKEVRALTAACVAAESARAAADGAHAQAATKLRRRLGALTRLDPAAGLTALGSVRSLSQWMDDERLLAAIAKHDRELWAAHEAARAQLDSTIALAQERAKGLEEAQSQRRAARDALARTRQSKHRVLQTMRRRSARAVGSELQLAQARLTQVVQAAAAQGSSSEAVTGTSGTSKLVRSGRSGLPWPASGPVRLGFGQHTETAFGTATFHNGWDIAAAAGSPVAAVASGVVAYASWLYGYGQVAILEHPGGYHTVHGHLSRLQVAAGQRVKQGDILGAVGDTGSLRGTVLYFEIRHRGLPQDPRLFMGRRR